MACESVRRTMPRNSRRLVRTEKIVGERIRSRCASAGRWSSRIRSRAPPAPRPPAAVSTRASHQVCPIARVLLVTTSCRGTKNCARRRRRPDARDSPDRRHAMHRSARSRTPRWPTCQAWQWRSGRRELLRHRGVGRDAAVEKIVGEGAEQVGDRLRQQLELSRESLAEDDVGAGRPGVERLRETARPARRRSGSAASHFTAAPRLREPNEPAKLADHPGARARVRVRATSTTVASTSSWMTSTAPRSPRGAPWRAVTPRSHLVRIRRVVSTISLTSSRRSRRARALFSQPLDRLERRREVAAEVGDLRGRAPGLFDGFLGGGQHADRDHHEGECDHDQRNRDAGPIQRGMLPSMLQQCHFRQSNPHPRLDPASVPRALRDASSLRGHRRRAARRHDPPCRQQERRAADPRRDAARRRTGRPSTTSRASATSRRMLELLADLGAVGRVDRAQTRFGSTRARCKPKPLDPGALHHIRASILLAGPLLARFGRVDVPPPGGDVIGRRRVDTHFLALERLGATVNVGDDFSHRGARGW